MEMEYSPELFIPFSIKQEKAISYFKDFMQQRKAPKKSYNDENIMSVFAVYIPTYYFSLNIDAKINALYYESNSKSPAYYYPVDTEIAMKTYAIQSVCTDFGKDEIRGLGKFDINDALIFDSNTFKGIVSKNQNVDVEKIEEEMKMDALLEINNEILRRETADKFLHGNIKLDFKNIERRAILVPVWILKTKNNGKESYYLINGQTGQIYSREIPISIINHIKAPLKSTLKVSTIAGVTIGVFWWLISLINENSDILFSEIFMVMLCIFIIGMWFGGMGSLILMIFSIKDLRKTVPGERIQIIEKNEKYYNNKKNGYSDRLVPLGTQIFFSVNGKDLEEKKTKILNNIKVEGRCR